MRSLHRPLSKISLFTFLAGFLCITNLGVAQSGGEYQATLKRASLLLRGYSYDEAIAAYKEAIRLSNGKQYGPYYGIAQAYNAKNDTQNVPAACDQMLALAPNDPIRAQGHRLKGLALLKDGMSDKNILPRAEKEFREALTLDDLYMQVHWELGVTLILENKDADGIAEMKNYVREMQDSDEKDVLEKTIEEVSDPKVSGAVLRSAIIYAQKNGPENAHNDSEAPVGAPDAGDSPKPLLIPAGQPLPAMEFMTLQKKKLTTASLKGKVVLLDFWASWCGPCRSAVPELARIFKETDQNKFVLISISEDHNEKAWRTYIDMFHMDWVQAYDEGGRLYDRLLQEGKAGLPSYFVIDAKGIIHQFYEGWGPGQRQRVQAAINQWLADAH